MSLTQLTLARGACRPVLKLAVPAAGVAMVAVLTAATAYAAATDRFESHQLQAAAAATLAAGGAAFWLGLVGPAGARPPTSPEALFFSGAFFSQGRQGRAEGDEGP